jgi:uncharacterized protein YodC (DUF2158 family)
MSDFKNGDVVVLKSSPNQKMTIREIIDNQILCEWRDNNGNPQSQKYAEYQLNKFKKNMSTINQFKNARYNR